MTESSRQAGEKARLASTTRSIRKVLLLTCAWMTVEAGVALWAAWQARSPALLAFGGDSAVELLSALVVLHGFRQGHTRWVAPFALWATSARRGREILKGQTSRVARLPPPASNEARPRRAGPRAPARLSVSGSLGAAERGPAPINSGDQEQRQQRSARIAGGLLLVLAVYVAATAAWALLGHVEPRPSPLGIAVLVAAALIMPALAWRKRQLAARVGSAAVRADAAQSGLCAYFSLIALAGLVANAAAGAGWADPVAALLIIPLIVREGRRARSGRCCD